MTGREIRKIFFFGYWEWIRKYLMRFAQLHLHLRFATILNRLMKILYAFPSFFLSNFCIRQYSSYAFCIWICTLCHKLLAGPGYTAFSVCGQRGLLDTKKRFTEVNNNGKPSRLQVYKQLIHDAYLSTCTDIRHEHRVVHQQYSLDEKRASLAFKSYFHWYRGKNTHTLM